MSFQVRNVWWEVCYNFADRSYNNAFSVFPGLWLTKCTVTKRCTTVLGTSVWIT